MREIAAREFNDGSSESRSPVRTPLGTGVLDKARGGSPKMKKALILVVLALLIGVGGWRWWQGRQQAKQIEYATAPLTRGPIESLVSATGTLQASETVEVGSQVSGTIARLAADFNDHVKKGQVLAVMDTEILDAAVTDAESGVSRAQAELSQAKADFGRSDRLFKEGLIAASDFGPAQTAVKTAEASYRSAFSALERARKNRKNAVILSPIDGVVVERAVEVGQTVAASLSAPKLFTLAGDLRQMEILSDVDESDVGVIKPGQPVRFTVAAFPDLSLTGQVQSVRLLPKVLQNVVTYTVVVSAENPESKLLPGMTATVDFVIDRVDDVWKVPAAALRFQPPAEVLAELRANGGGRGERAGREGRQRGAGAARSGRAEGQAGNRSEGQAGGQSQRSPRGKGLWLLVDGKLARQPVEIGATDGRFTAVTPLRGSFSEGMQVVTGIVGQPNTPASPSGGGRGGNRGGGNRFRNPFFG